ncbi:hypothetical protein CH276_18805 [Rhodococcus sp. 06-470-2]|uniref:hypothetical protein n=1 Tax=unclassified Rhodococcus (in: high G+C Gram-positive bacteria) TaxID=192944 RepID=UPI000B9C68DA|nr:MULTISPECIES: hypothetical protein [unclassified Rhodococcus (in: high G+C Gram-positive bacteria)]OZC60028.1 hypothetical protein CH276_18805 [Rhodococcus sp. 06-470-2]OZE56962.1 hypothetical protein CH265_24550 [Rhodococcus sp. 05-2221-1B]
MSESTVTVKANQATTDWQDGAIFTVERTDYIDKLLNNGILSIYVPDGDPVYVGDGVVLGERYDPDAAPLTDDDAKAAGFDLDNPDALPPASGDDELTDEQAEDAANAVEMEPTADAATEPADSKPRSKRAAAPKKADDVGE